MEFPLDSDECVLFLVSYNSGRKQNSSYVEEEDALQRGVIFHLCDQLLASKGLYRLAVVVNCYFLSF